MKVIELNHRNKDWYGISLSLTDKRIVKIKQITGRKWSQTNKMWLIPQTNQNKIFLKSISKPKPQLKQKAPKAIKKLNLQVLILKGNRLRIPFYPSKQGVSFIKTLSYWQYDSQYKHWTIPFTDEIISQLTQIWKSDKKIVEIVDKRIKTIKPKIQIPKEYQRTCPEAVKNKLEMMRYSESTVKTYTHMLNQFFTYYHAYKPSEITNEQIKSYLRYLVQEREVSESFQNQAINAIKFYYEKVLGGVRQTYYIDRPKKSKYLPTVLSQEETKKLLQNIGNLKHKLIITLIYSGGLRISELINLELVDIDYDSKRIHIKNAKGKKDRYIPLAERTKSVITYYIKKYNPEIYMVEGIKGGKYSTSSIQKFFKKYCLQCGITKKVSPHTLRHSFATHMLENGIDLRYIQHLLGHSSSKTTEIYTHITQSGINNIKNPIDQFEF